uniref:Sepiapterin reductase n=1 Tax=Anopheles dirus TaxID=7168 RepID=A0A182NTM9_9DIPT
MNFADPWVTQDNTESDSISSISNNNSNTSTNPTTISVHIPPTAAAATIVQEENTIVAIAASLEFEDNFIPQQPPLNPRQPQDNRLPDSDNYLAALEKRLHRLKHNPGVLQQLAERREACMQSLLAGSIALRTDADLELEEPVNSNELLRFIRPEQALSQAEVVQLVQHDQLQLDAEEYDESHEGEESGTETTTTAVNLEQVAYFLVTGASRGIGAKMAIETARKLKPGSVVVLLARSASGLESTRSEILTVNPHVTVVTSSVDLATASKELLNEILDKSLGKQPVDRFGLACVIHNVGTVGNVGRKAAELDDRADWEQYFGTNLFTVAVLNSCFLRKFQPVPDRLVVNITSKACLVPFQSMAYYCAGKAAREMYFRVLAEEEASAGVTVLNYSPGPVDTEMTVDLQANSNAPGIRDYFKNLRDTTTILTTEQTTAKFLRILENGLFQSGDHIPCWCAVCGGKMLINSSLGRTFLFLTNLAWKNRVALPALIMVGCMVFNYRGEIEINIHTERIALHDLPNRQHGGGGGGAGGGAFGAIAIDLDDYSDEEDEFEDEDLLEYYDSEDDDDEYSYDEDDLYSSYDEEDDNETADGVNEGEHGPDEGGTLNGTIRINRFATVNIHNARR